MSDETTTTTTERAPCWRLLDTLAELPADARRHALLVGPPGTGKTFLGRVLAEAEGLPHYNVTVSGRTVPTDLLFGSWIAPSGASVLQYRPGLQAWGVGEHAAGVLVVNEVNEASEDALLALGALLDDNGSARIALPTGETVRPAEGFRCVATANVGVRDLPERLLDRFRVRVLVDAPAPAILRALRPDTRAGVVAVYQSLGWTLEAGGEVPMFSAREALSFDAIRAHVGDDDASTLVWGAVRGAAIRDHIAAAAREAGVTKADVRAFLAGREGR